MKKLILLFAGLLSLSLPMQAQNSLITVTGSKLSDPSGNLVSNATLCGQLTTTNASPLSVELAGGGQTTQPPVCTSVSNGAFSINLPDTNRTQPQNACVAVTVTDNTSGNTLLSNGYGCVQPTSLSGSNWCSTTSGVTSCNFDLYQPNFASQALVQTGPTPVLSIGTVTTGSSAAASITGPISTPVLNLTIPQGLQGIPGSITATGVNGAFTVPGLFSSTGENLAGTDATCTAGSASICQNLTATLGTFPSTTQDLVNQTFNVYGPGKSQAARWRITKGMDMNDTFAARGITNPTGENDYKHAVGDIANYWYLYSDGGCATGADECIKGFAMHVGETTGWFHGTVSSTTGTGDEYPALAFSSGNAWTTDGATLLDISKGTISGYFNGSGARVAGATQGLPYIPVTNTLPITTAWGQLTTTIPLVSRAANVATVSTFSYVPYYVSGTGAINPITPSTPSFIGVGSQSGNTLTISSTTTGSLAVGTMIYGNLMVEGTTITAVLGGNTYTVSGASQTVASGPIYGTAGTQSLVAIPGPSDPEQAVVLAVGAAPTTALFNASFSGTTMTVNSVTSGTIAVGQYVSGPGVTSLTHITGGSGTSWTVSNSMTIASENVGSATAQTITMSIRNYQAVSAPYLFQGGIAGQFISFDADLAQSGERFSWPAYGSLTGNDLIYWVNLKENQQGVPLFVANGNNGATAEQPWSGYHLYPGAEVIQNKSVGYTPQLEYNNVPWTANDVVENPHFPAIGVSGETLYAQQDSPALVGTVGRSILVSGKGMGGSVVVDQVQNGNPSSYYTFGGGWMTPPYGLNLLGYFNNAIYLNNTPTTCLICIQNNVSQGASFTGSAASGVLTVSAVTSGWLVSGQDVLEGTTVVGHIGTQLSAPSGSQSGGVGTYSFYSSSSSYNTIASTSLTTAQGSWTVLGTPDLTITEDPTSGTASIVGGPNGLTLSTTTNNVPFTGGITVTGLGVITTQIIPTGTVPTIVAGAGAGTSPSATISGSNMAGVINITTGTGTFPVANSLFATITFNTTMATSFKGCKLEARNAASASILLDVYVPSPTNTSWSIYLGAQATTLAPVASTLYSYYYECQ